MNSFDDIKNSEDNCHRDERDKKRSKVENQREDVEEERSHLENDNGCSSHRNDSERALETRLRADDENALLSTRATSCSNSVSNNIPSSRPLVVPDTPPTSTNVFHNSSGMKDQESPKKTVTFASVTLNYHSVGLGDSPSVTKGVPIALTSELLGRHVHATVDLYECFRPGHQDKKNMRLKPSERRQILLRQGISPEEIEFCINLVELIKEKQRDKEYDDDDDCEDSIDVYNTYSQCRSGGCCTTIHTNQDDLMSPYTWFDWVCKS